MATLRKILEAAIRTRNELTTIIGNEAVNFYQDNFDRQGFLDQNLTKWPKRRNDKSRRSRAILVKSGNLRRSIRVTKRTSTTVIVGSDLDYAQIHNQGGTINIPAQTRVLSFKKRQRGKGKGRVRFVKENQAQFQQQVTIPAHTVTMPKRQFIGRSAKLNQQISKAILNRFKDLLK